MRCRPVISTSAISCPVASFIRITMTRAECRRIFSPNPGVEEALYDSRAMRRFVGIDLGREPALDETIICKFRYLLEANGLGEAISQTVGEHLKSPAPRFLWTVI